MSQRPRTDLAISNDERLLLIDALWVWEDAFRSSRAAHRKAGTATSELEAIAARRIAAIRNLKARLFRCGVKP